MKNILKNIFIKKKLFEKKSLKRQNIFFFKLHPEKLSSENKLHKKI